MVRRPRLEQLLEDGRRRRVTLVCAPPGSGKTTLVAAWFADVDSVRARWVTAGSGDDHQFGAVLENAAAGALDLLVVDDAHHLDGSALAGLAGLLADLPAGLDVVVAARADPPLTLTSLRLRALVREIRSADLAFTCDEAAELLGQNGVRIRRSDVIRLHACTEGWAAGLRLMNCALERGASAAGLAEDEAAAQAVVSDFLLTEVLEREDPDVRQFLLRTSVADRLTPELAVLLADDPRGGELLEDLHRRGVFVVALDRGWFRYHSLFAALLRARLRVEDPTLVRQLHRWAACWFAAQELPGPAEAHARAGEQWTLLGDLVHRRWRHAMLDGTEVAVAAASLPDAALAADPTLALLGTASPHLNGGGGPLVDEAAIVSRLIACTSGEALDVRPHHGRDVALRPVVGVLDVELLLLDGQLEEAVSAAVGLLHSSVAWVEADAKALIALALAIGGQVAGAGRQAGELALHPAVVSGRGRLGAASGVLTGGICDLQRGRPIDRGPIERIAAAHPSAALRTCARAVLGCRSVDGSAVGLDPGLARGPLAARVFVALGALDVVDATGARIAVGGEADKSVLQARHALASGAPQSASGLATTALAVVGSHPRTRAEAAVIRAAAGVDEPDDDRAVLDALSEASASSMWAPFVTHARALSEPLDRVARRPGPLQSVAIDALDLVQGSVPTTSVEPLTDREVTVLQLLPSLMSNDEIARAMHLSVNTVKTHLKALYRKLAVERRRDAVVRARELGLL